MARTMAGLPAGTRITDFISLGAVAGWVPIEKVHEVLEQEAGRTSASASASSRRTWSSTT